MEAREVLSSPRLTDEDAEAWRSEIPGSLGVVVLPPGRLPRGALGLLGGGELNWNTRCWLLPFRGRGLRVYRLLTSPRL